MRKVCQQRFDNAIADPRDVVTHWNQTFARSTSVVSEQTVGYLHINTLYPRNAIPLATDYLFSLRNPISRVASWFAYNHPRSCDPVRDNLSPSCQLHFRRRGDTWVRDFFACFNTVDEFAMALIPAEDQSENSIENGDKLDGQGINAEFRSPVCRRLAWRAIKGDGPPQELNHMLWNYRVSTD